jgi:hypothetical protein
MRQAACAPGLCWPFCWPPTVCWPAGFRRGPASGTCGRQRWAPQVMCGVRPTKRREGLAWRIPVPVLCCAWRREGDVLLLILPLLYVRLLLTLAPPVCLSLTSYFVRSSLAGYRTLNFLLLRIPLPIQHCDHGDCVSSEQRLRPKVSGRSGGANDGRAGHKCVLGRLQ